MAVNLINPDEFKEQVRELNSAFEAYAFNDDTRQTILNGQRALRKLSEWAAEYDYNDAKPCAACNRKGISAADAGKTAAYLQKVVGDAVMLMEKAQAATRLRNEQKGNLADLLQYLNNEQFEIVSGWIEANRKNA